MAPLFYYYCLPLLLLFALMEGWHSWKERKELFSASDTTSNIIIGISLGLFNIFSRFLLFATLSWVYQYRFFTLPHSVWTMVLVFLLTDFTYYWYHRICHEVNWFWASHVVHHSSEHINITIAFRQSITSGITGHNLFWIWMALVGFHPFQVALALQICVFYQSFLHTETIRTLPCWFEFLFNTPSHHRVHHASNPEYLDKNHGGMLIIWDRLFGTFCAEKEKPVYGLTTPLHSTNPVQIIFHGWKDLLTQALHCRNLLQGISCLFKAPGWSADGHTLTVKQMRKREKIQESVRA